MNQLPAAGVMTLGSDMFNVKLFIAARTAE